MAYLGLTVVDKKVRRVTEYEGWTGPLFIASLNPRSVEEFDQFHQEQIGEPVFREQALSYEELRNIDDFTLADIVKHQGLLSMLKANASMHGMTLAAGLASYSSKAELLKLKLKLKKQLLLMEVATCARPYNVLEELSYEQLVEIACSPNYTDHTPKENVGTALCAGEQSAEYDGVLVVDLRAAKKELSFRGVSADYIPKGEETSADRKNPEYHWFGKLSTVRKGEAKYGDSVFKYVLNKSWTIVDLETGKRR